MASDPGAEHSARLIARAAETLRRIDERLETRRLDGRPRRRPARERIRDAAANLALDKPPGYVTVADVLAAENDFVKELESEVDPAAPRG